MPEKSAGIASEPSNSKTLSPQEIKYLLLHTHTPSHPSADLSDFLSVLTQRLMPLRRPSVWQHGTPKRLEAVLVIKLWSNPLFSSASSFVFIPEPAFPLREKNIKRLMHTRRPTPFRN
jgi:hypothetical protein